MISASSELLTDLQIWYLAQCDGQWEHLYGISIKTLDNPGWKFTVDLSHTQLSDRVFADIRIENADKNDWYTCRVRNHVFEAFCGPNRLSDVIGVFLDWAGQSPGIPQT